MDKETRAALELTSEQLRAMRDAAEPGIVGKREGASSGIRPRWDEDSLVVTRVTFGGHGATAFVVSSSAETTNCVPA
jgi:hypothetical protein